MGLNWAMANPYQIDPKALETLTKQAQEQQLITLADDSTRPPPTRGTPSWQGSIVGPWLGQPASRLQTFDRGPKPRHGALNLVIGLGSIGVLLFSFWLIFR